MRDYRDAKAMAQTLRSALAAKGHKITTSESLELIAKSLGFPDWNTLAAAIKVAPKGGAPAADPPAESTISVFQQLKAVAESDHVGESLERMARAFGFPDWRSLSGIIKATTPAPGGSAGDDAPALEQLAKALGAANFQHLLAAIRTNAAAGPRPAADQSAVPSAQPRRRGVSFTPALEATLHRAVAEAKAREHEYTTLEHLLRALVDDADAAAVMDACQVDRAALSRAVARYLDEELGSLVKPGPADPSPTAGFHRVVQRAVIHVQSAGRPEVTGANILVAVFSEQESHAAFFLQQRKMTRWDAVNFIAHGIRKGGAAA